MKEKGKWGEVGWGAVGIGGRSLQLQAIKFQECKRYVLKEEFYKVVEIKMFL